MGTSFTFTLPTRGDGRSADPARHNRGGWNPQAHRTFAPHLRDERGPGGAVFGAADHLSQVARAAELAGFDGIVAPYDPDGEESWVLSSVVARQSRWPLIIPELTPGFATPVYAAKMSATLQRLTGGRLVWQLAVDVPPAVARSQGDFVEGPDRFVRADEFVTAAKGVWNEQGYSFEGRFYQVFEGGFAAPLNNEPFPRVWVKGTSDEAVALSARHADVHVLDLADTDVVDTRITAVRAAADAAGRDVGIALRLPVVARDDEDEAWAKVRRSWREVGVEGDGDPAGLVTAPNVWGGFDRIGHRQAVGLVGSYDQVADVLSGWVDRGVEGFVLDAAPRLEEAYRLGEHLLPRVVAHQETPVAVGEER